MQNDKLNTYATFFVASNWHPP